MNEVIPAGLDDNLFYAYPHVNSPDDYVPRTDTIFYRSYQHYRLLNALLSFYCILKIISSIVIVIIDRASNYFPFNVHDLWCIILIPVSALQFYYYRSMGGATKSLEAFIHLARCLDHIEYVHKSTLADGASPLTIENSINTEVYDFTRDESDEQDDKKISILAIQIKYQAQQISGKILLLARISFALYQLMHLWGAYIFFWVEFKNVLLEKYIMLILVIGTYQYIEIYVISAIVCICLPFYGIVQLFRVCFLKINSNRFIRLLKPKKFRPSDVKGEHYCRICLIPYTSYDKIITLPCNEMHHFHSMCIKTWLKVSITCPLCRQSFTNLTQEQINRIMVEMH